MEESKIDWAKGEYDRWNCQCFRPSRRLLQCPAFLFDPKDWNRSQSSPFPPIPSCGLVGPICNLVCCREQVRVLLRCKSWCDLFPMWAHGIRWSTVCTAFDGFKSLKSRSDGSKLHVQQMHGCDLVMGWFLNDLHIYVLFSQRIGAFSRKPWCDKSLIPFFFFFFFEIKFWKNKILFFHKYIFLFIYKN